MPYRIHPILLLALAAGALPTRLDAQPCPGGVCPQPMAQSRARAPALDGRLTQAIVRVRNQLVGGTMLGSGTLVEKSGDCGIILSCAHLFREGQGTLVVAFPNGQHYAAELLAIDRQRDLSVLAIDVPPASPLPVAKSAPQPGQPLWSSGYGGDDRLWTNQGQALGFISLQGGPANTGIALSGSARNGDSGGPILNEQGQVAGVIFGTNGQVVDGTHCVEVCKFLEALRARAQVRLRPVLPPRLPQPLPSPEVKLSPPQLADDAARLQQTEISRKDAVIAGLQARLDELLRANSDAHSVDVPAGPSSPLERAAASAGSAWLAGALVSVGVPGGIAAIVAGGAVWLAMRRGRRRLSSRIDGLRAATAAIPAEPQIIKRHHNQFVAYEVTELDKAWAMAHAQVGQKYPGAVPYLKIAEGVKDQLVSGGKE